VPGWIEGDSTTCGILQSIMKTSAVIYLFLTKALHPALTSKQGINHKDESHAEKGRIRPLA
jgi:hypothetical protein